MFAVELIDTGQATPSYQWSQVERLPLRKLEPRSVFLEFVYFSFVPLGKGNMQI